MTVGLDCLIRLVIILWAVSEMLKASDLAMRMFGI